MFVTFLSDCRIVFDYISDLPCLTKFAVGTVTVPMTMTSVLTAEGKGIECVEKIKLIF